MATVLVVDDVLPVRQFVARVLERGGHQVLQCGDAASALSVTGDLDLLIVDYELPDMNGRELIARVREARPSLPVILMSGHVLDPALEPPGSTFMQKPMTPATVIDTVRKVLPAP